MSDSIVAASGRDATRGNLLARIDWLNLSGLVFYHLVALCALLPWLFSWSSVFLCLAGVYVFGTLGINVCYHRLLTHRGFTCPKWLEHGFAILAVCAFQDTPTRWVAIHRRHHEHADEEPDPHSPIVNFLWAHIGWVVTKSPDTERMQIYSRYAKDIVRDPFYRKLDKPHVYLGIILASWGIFFFGGMAASLLAGQGAAYAAQFGLSLLVWGVFVRTVIVWHITWSVNSVTHVWGYRNYDTSDDSTNNVVIGFLSNGEGWHNNHHADPRSARHGHKWWEFDVTYQSIRLLARLGLAGKIAMPRKH